MLNESDDEESVGTSCCMLSQLFSDAKGVVVRNMFLFPTIFHGFQVTHVFMDLLWDLLQGRLEMNIYELAQKHVD